MRHKLRRTNLVQLERRFSSPVHDLTPDSFEIPSYVMAHLAKGGKFIPDTARSSATSLLREVDVFERSLNLTAFFDGVSERAGRNSRCKLKSSWQPPRDPSVSSYCRLLREELAGYSPRDKIRNEDLIDKAARAWLDKHWHMICIVDADKNLGDAIVPRKWVDQESLRLLHEAAILTNEATYQIETSELKYAMDSFLLAAFASGTISDRDVKFLLSKFHSAKIGSFRLRIKLHKSPVVGRPIFNMTRSWLAPAAIYLVEALQPLEKSLGHTIGSSAQLQDLLEGWQVTEVAATMVTYDIKNLYPSVQRDHFLTTFAKRVRRHWNAKPQYALFVIKLTEFVLACQHVQFQQKLWKVDKGLPTGLQASVVLANLYLAELDDIISQQCTELIFWKRYIDDAFALLRSNATETCRLSLNSWHPDIQWEVSDHGTQVAFLDLDIQLRYGRFLFQTFRKPRNAYLYIPRISCHPEGVFKALIIGEAQRLFRHNRQDQAALERHSNFFLNKLRLRGHSRQEAALIMQKTFLKLQRRETKPTAKNRRVFFRQTYSSTLDRRFVKRALNKHWHVLRSCFNKTVSPILSFRVQKNSFRRNFSHNWLCAAPSEGYWRRELGFLHAHAKNLYMQSLWCQDLFRCRHVLRSVCHRSISLKR